MNMLLRARPREAFIALGPLALILALSLWPLWGETAPLLRLVLAWLLVNAGMGLYYARLRHRIGPSLSKAECGRFDAFFALRVLVNTLGLWAGYAYGLLRLGLPHRPLLLLFFGALLFIHWLLFFIDGEILAYLIVGGLTTLVSILSFDALSLVLSQGSRHPHWLAVKLPSLALTLLFAYGMNRRFVFHSQAPWLPELGRFLLARLGVACIVEVGGLGLLLRLFHIEARLANLLVAFVVVIVNYVASKGPVFRSQPHVDL